MLFVSGGSSPVVLPPPVPWCWAFGQQEPMGEGCIHYCFKARQGEIIKHELKNLRFKAVPVRAR